SDPAWPGGPDHESAIGHLTQALQIPELDTEARGTALLNLSLSYQRRIRGDITGNQDAALRYAAEAYDLFSALGSGPSTASAAAAIGDALGERLVRSGAADLSEAIGWYERALALAPADQAPLQHATIASGLANALVQRGDASTDDLRRAVGLLEGT